jgi:hypothetical protein
LKESGNLSKQNSLADADVTKYKQQSAAADDRK